MALAFLAMDANLGSGLRRLLSQMSGHPIGDRDYVAYFVNEHGERLVFVRESGKRPAVLLHSDLDWKPTYVEGPPKSGADVPELPPKVRRFLWDVPVLGDVILDGAEALWLKACLVASERW